MWVQIYNHSIHSGANEELLQSIQNIINRNSLLLLEIKQTGLHKMIKVNRKEKPLFGYTNLPKIKRGVKK